MNEKLIARYDELIAQRALLNMDKDRLLDQVVPAEVKAQISDIESEFADKLTAINAQIAEAEAQAKADVLAGGQTVKAHGWEFRVNKGKTSYDTKLLDGMATLIPQILTARKEGEPYVSIYRKGRE